MDAGRERPRTSLARPLTGGRPLALLATLLVAFQAAEQEEVFLYDEPAAVIEGRPIDRPMASRMERLEARLGAETVERIRAFLEARDVRHTGDFDAAGEWFVWDEAVADDFDVYMARVEDLTSERGPVAIPLASGPAHQVRPRAVERRGYTWVAWEEGPDDWGGTYRSVDRTWDNATDASGPLHSWSRVRLARLVRTDETITDYRGLTFFYDLPEPALARAGADDARREGCERLGVYYERPEIVVDGEDAIWLAYRHQQQAQLARDESTRTHIERGYTVDLLRIEGRDLTGPYRLSDLQRDGNQELRIEALERGVRVHAEAGRRDRVRREGEPRWLTHDVVPPLDGSERSGELVSGNRLMLLPQLEAPRAPERDFAVSGAEGDSSHTLLYGDLHRHTDLSLCFPFYDGSLDDAYRYARGPGGLDFVAITDHARDLDRGNVGGLPWDLTVSAVNRHHEPGRFAAFYSYERSQGNTDHNVISLDADVLRPHQPPLRTFWEAYPGDRVITIPHATSHKAGARFCGNVWTKRDDDRRMLAEVYQSYRDVVSFAEITEKAHAAGHPLGFIASSDHLSTSAAYACVWAPGKGAEAVDREPIFEALRARRTFGATAKVVLEARSGDAWMGEELEGDGPFPIEVAARGEAPVAKVEFWANGALAHEVEWPEGGRTRWEWSGAPEDTFGWCSVVVRFGDGERAWASPFFARWDRAGARKR